MTKYSLDILLFSFEPVHCSMSGFHCCFLTCIQISQEVGKVVWYSHLLKNFPQFIVIQTIKGFSVVNKREVDIFLELSCFFYDPTHVGNLISGSSVFSKSSLNNCWSLAWRILSITLLACEMNAVVQQFEHSLALLSLGLEWKLTFSSPVATAEFSKFANILSAALSQHHLPGFEIAQLEFHHLH